MEQFIQFITEHYIMSTLWLVVFIMLVMDIFKRRFSTVASLSPQEAVLVTNRGGIFVDIRSEEEFNQGHIHNSRQLTLQNIREGNIKTLERFKDAPIVTVCNYGNTARSAAASLVKAGFSNVSILQGGLQAWRGANLPLSKKKSQAAKTQNNKK